MHFQRLGGADGNSGEGQRLETHPATTHATYTAAVSTSHPHSLRPVLGLIGGIGAGKSEVGRILRDLGCVVCHSDDLARQALDDPAIRAQIVSWWGPGMLDSAGSIKRSAVARIVFSESAERKRLEQLTHPWIERRRLEQFATAPAGTRAFVIDAPLLLEAGLDDQCDAIVFVEAPREDRLARVREGRGWDAEELARREESQIPLDRKRQRADYVVVNDVDRSTLNQRVRDVLEQIERECV